MIESTLLHARSKGVTTPNLSWHSLQYGLRRYLIIFDPHTFVLDQWRSTWWLLSL